MSSRMICSVGNVETSFANWPFGSSEPMTSELLLASIQRLRMAAEAMDARTQETGETEVDPTCWTKSQVLKENLILV